MAEQFALEQSRRNRGAIHSDERLVAARTSIVDGASDEFLARPCFAEDENRGVGRSHDFDLIQRSREGSAPADKVLEFILRAHLLLEVLRFWITCRLRVGWASKSVARIQGTDGPLTPALSPSERERGNRVQCFCESRFVDGIAGDTSSFRGRAPLHEQELEVTERVWFGAGESQNAEAAIPDHQRETAKGLDACFQQSPGKLGKARFCVCADRKLLLMLPHPPRD